jgi:2-(1,2-epoxy-1,2-dihydrophenyl)acetyl-CoA isomerase
MEFERASLELDGAVAVLTLNHPDVLNALSLEMLKGIGDALDALVHERARCLVITGAGRAFSTGANLQGRADAKFPRGAGHTLETQFHPMLRRLRDLPCPIITAVNGPAAGAGMSLALMGDLVLCARSAYFLQAFRRIGLVPDCGSTWLLPRLIGRARAIELSLLGERLPAETALTWGLVNRVLDDEALIPEARRLAGELASGPTVALGLIRRLYWDSPDNSFEQQLDLESRTQRIAGDTADFKEGVRAFLEKRPAQFSGA